MRTSSGMARAAFVVVASLPFLLGNRGCSSDDSTKTDDRRDGGGGGACKPADCEGQEVPAIACADGPTLIVCERDDRGECRAQVRCGTADGGAGGGDTCGGFAGVACAEGLFCNVEKNAGGDGCGNVADGQGVCQPLPEACEDIYLPVCGCDYRSYGNACEAHAKGVSVLHDELCTRAECEKIGGRAVFSDGASTPRCAEGEESYALPADEPALCCVPGSGGELRWYETCGDPVCSGHRDSSLPACTAQDAGEACSESGAECDPGNDCNSTLRCTDQDPTQGPGGCPISRARFKTEVVYLDEDELARTHERVMGLGVARYHYLHDPSRQERLGFIIEDVEPSEFVDEARDRVDLYAYTSAVVAALQVQQKQIRALEAQVRTLEKQLTRERKAR